MVLVEYISGHGLFTDISYGQGGQGTGILRLVLVFQ